MTVMRSQQQLGADTRRAGQTIVEVIIATAVVGLVMTAIVAIGSVSLRNTSRAKAKALATKYTQEGIEYFRTQRNLLGWESMFQTLKQNSGGVTYCMATLPYTQTGGLGNLPNRACLPTEFVDVRQIYQRRAHVTTSVVGGQNVITVVVTVSWNDSGNQQISTAALELRQNQN
jgi:Tfp pilus assembly protein PilE